MTHIIVRDAKHCQVHQEKLAKYSVPLNNSPMNTIQQIRLANLRLLIEESEAVVVGNKTFGAGTATALAKKCNTSAGYLSQILTRLPNPSGKSREMGTSLARKLEKGANKPIGWMDIKHEKLDPKEEEMRRLFAVLDADLREAILQQARILSKIGK